MDNSNKALSFEQARNLLPDEFRPNVESAGRKKLLNTPMGLVAYHYSSLLKDGLWKTSHNEDEIRDTVDLVLSQPNPTKKKLEKAIISVAQREQIQEQAALKKAQEEAQERKKAQREAEQRRKKREIEAMLRQREESFIVALDVFLY